MHGAANGEKLSDTLRSVAARAEDMAMNGLLDMIFGKNGKGGIDFASLFSGGGSGGGGFGDFLGAIFGGATGMPTWGGPHDSGGYIGAGSIGLVGERGPELVQGPAYVTSRTDTARSLKNAGGKAPAVHVYNNAAGVEVTPYVTNDEVHMIVEHRVNRALNANNANINAIVARGRMRAP